MTLETDIAALERALNSGQKSVQFNGRRVDFQDAETMRARLRELKQQQAGGKTFRAMIQYSSSRGW